MSNLNLITAKEELNTCLQNEGGCEWGSCKKCGVPNLIVKLATERLVEEEMEPEEALEMIEELL